MMFRSILNKRLFTFAPFARISDLALAAVGYRGNAEETEQPIPTNLAVKSALMLVPIYLAASLFAGIMMESTGIQIRFHFYIWFPYFYVWDGLLAGGWIMLGFLLAPLQIMRVRRLNRLERRHRLGDLERMAKRETAIQENAPDLSRYAVKESSVQIVTGS